jgi:transposase InsO family protein
MGKRTKLLMHWYATKKPARSEVLRRNLRVGRGTCFSSWKVDGCLKERGIEHGRLESECEFEG